MDSNKYRRGTKYKDRSLSEEKSIEFLNRINRRGERKCIAMVKSNVGTEEEWIVCGKKFMSEGAHNRICPNCKSKAENKYNNKKSRELIEYSTYSQPEHRTLEYRGE